MYMYIYIYMCVYIYCMYVDPPHRLPFVYRVRQPAHQHEPQDVPRLPRALQGCLKGLARQPGRPAREHQLPRHGPATCLRGRAMLVRRHRLRRGRSGCCGGEAGRGRSGRAGRRAAVELRAGAGAGGCGGAGAAGRWGRRRGRGSCAGGSGAARRRGGAPRRRRTRFSLVIFCIFSLAHHDYV